MGKLPYQLIVNVISFLSVGVFVFWTSNGGLHNHINELFGKDATSQDLKDRVGHIGDLCYYYAIVASFLFVLLTVLKALQIRLLPSLQKIIPSDSDFKQLLVDEFQAVVVFMGIYVYLIYNNGIGMKNKQMVLFPYWFLVAYILEVIGRTLNNLFSKKIIFTRASFFLYCSLIIIMLCQIAGYRPFKVL